MKLHPHFIWRDLFHRVPAEKTKLVDALRKNILFETLNPQDLKILSTIIFERIYQPGETIFTQNERGIGMYIILQGKVSIKNSTPQDEVLITSLGEGSFFGELALIDPENLRSASVIADERTVVAGFFKPDLMDLLERRPETGVKILFQLCKILGRRLIESSEKISFLSQARMTLSENRL